MTSVVSKREAAEIIKNYKGGTFFTVTFVKRTDGTVRTMNCRKGVTRGINGHGRSFDPEQRNLVSVYDVQKQGHRYISLEDIREVKIRKQVFVAK